MYKNTSESGEHVYIIQIQHGQIGMKGTWYSKNSDYEKAFNHFLEKVDKNKCISIFDENGMGLYIHIGPGMTVMFMTKEMENRLQLQASSRIVQPR